MTANEVFKGLLQSQTIQVVPFKAHITCYPNWIFDISLIDNAWYTTAYSILFHF